MRIFLPFLVMLVIITACSVASPTTNSPTSAPSAVTPPYPVTENQPAYPAPTYEVPTQPVWTPDPASGSVKGSLLLLNNPVDGANLYLATTVKNSQNVEVAAQLDRSIAPTTVTKADGSFFFQNVPPGRYALMFEAMPNTYLLFKPGLPEAVVVEVKAGDEIQLGELNYEDLPK